MTETPSKKKSWALVLFAFLSILFILFAFAAPALFIRPSGFIIFNEKTAHIGETFGIMSPFIAIAAAMATFAAFWVQYQANKRLAEQNRLQLLTCQKEQRNAEIRNRKQQAINRFYEMLQIHKSNTKELGGRGIFNYHLAEFNLIYGIIDTLYPDHDIKDKIKKAYNLFYRDTEDERFTREFRHQMLKAMEDGHGKLNSDDIAPKAIEKISQLFQNFCNQWECQPYYLFQGHYDELNNYYQHLFLTVKNLAKQNANYLSYEEKRDLLQILRAQLSNTEQVMLCYHWASGNGREWEEDFANGNHFFTQYRMVYNITEGAYTKLKPYFDSCEYINRFGTKEDPIFEFQR